MSRRALGLAAVALVAGTLDARGSPPPSDPAEILRRADAPHEAFSEGVIRLRVTVRERGKEPQTSDLEIFVKGADLSLVVFRGGKQEGRRILTQGDRVFLIVPNAARAVPVSKTQRLMGAASFGDIARLRFAEEYDATARPDDEIVALPQGATPCRILDLTAKHKGSAYPKAVLAVGAYDGLPRRLRLMLTSGKAAKEVAFTAYDEAHRIARMEIRDLLGGEARENVTELDFVSYEKRALDPEIFEPEGARALP
jgi:hypothetical protein